MDESDSFIVILGRYLMKLYLYLLTEFIAAVADACDADDGAGQPAQHI